MAWLNINKEFGHKWHEMYDWEETPEEPWITTPEIEFLKTYGYWNSTIKRPLAGEDFPTHIGSRKAVIVKYGYWSFRRHHYPKVKNKSVWEFSQMVVNNYLGKSFNDAFNYYLKHTKHIPDRYNEFLHYNFEGRKPSYYIDEEGLIQKCVYPISKWKQDWNDAHRPTKLYTFKSADYRTEIVHKQSGVTLEEMKERDSKYWFSIFSLPKNPRLNSNKYVEIISNGYTIENVQPNSTLEKRLKAEKRQKEKQQRKYWKEQRKNKQYSFLTREEEEFKKAKIQDDNVLLKHGFNDESFKGAPYHGRQNKKK